MLAAGGGYEVIRDWLSDQCGMSFPEKKRDLLVHRLNRVLGTFGFANLDALAEQLTGGHAVELQLAIMHAASTNHTFFFREPQVLNYFRDNILPPLSQAGAVRIWSAAASSGDEAYTLAIIANGILGAAAAARVSILGTDISQPAISQAESAIYSASHLEHVPPDVLRRYFVPAGLGQYQVIPEIRRLCTFRRLNLKAAPYPFTKSPLEALEAGAVDVVAKPTLGVTDGLPIMLADICQRVKAAAQISVARFAGKERHPAVEPVAAVLGETTDHVIAIGASTGGVPALTQILPAFPADAPGIVLVQHMPSGFTASFAGRLNEICRMRVKEAEDGDRVLTGRILIAPGTYKHISLSLIRSGGEYRVALLDGPLVSFSRPSIDVLFHSAARHAGRNAAAVLMTGMGSDGASGLLAIRKAGGRTFAQNEASCVVFGMPRSAQELGAAEEMLPLERIPQALVAAAQSMMRLAAKEKI